jgi:prevent-host-death family protein
MSRARSATVGAAQFKARCLELVDHVKEARAEYIVTRHGTPVARLVPVEAEAPPSPLGSMQGTVVSYDGPFEPIPAAWSLDPGEPD